MSQVASNGHLSSGPAAHDLPPAPLPNKPLDPAEHGMDGQNFGPEFAAAKAANAAAPVGSKRANLTNPGASREGELKRLRPTDELTGDRDHATSPSLHDPPQPMDEDQHAPAPVAVQQQPAIGGHNSATLANNGHSMGMGITINIKASPAGSPRNVSILPPRPLRPVSAGAEPGLDKSSLSNPLMNLQLILADLPSSKGLGQLVTFAASTPINLKDHTQILQEVQRVLQREVDMRKDFVEFEEVMNLNPAAVTYGRKPSAVFPDLDAEFPSHEYDQIVFMRQFVSFMVTRLQLVCGLCPSKSKEEDLMNAITRTWWQRNMDYM